MPVRLGACYDYRTPAPHRISSACERVLPGKRMQQLFRRSEYISSGSSMHPSGDLPSPTMKQPSQQREGSKVTRVFFNGAYETSAPAAPVAQGRAEVGSNAPLPEQVRGTCRIGE